MEEEKEVGETAGVERERVMGTEAGAGGGGGVGCCEEAHAAAADAMPCDAIDDDVDVNVVPAPSIADVSACRYAAWHSLGRLGEHTFKSVTIPLSGDFVEYLLADGLSLAADSEALPARVKPDLAEQLESGFNPSDEEDDAAIIADASDASFEALRATFGGGGGKSDDESDGSVSDDDAAVGIGQVRSFPELEAKMRVAIGQLGGAVLPKLTWSTPKDAVWLATTNTMRCTNPGEVILLLKASDSVAYDLTDALGQCRDYDADKESGGAARAGLKTDVSVTLRKWFDLSPGMEFRCFVKGSNLRGICQRDVSNFYPYLPDMVPSLEELISVFWQDEVSRVFPLPDYVFDVYVTSKSRCRVVDFNPWGGATLPLLFDWHELTGPSVDGLEAGERNGEDGADGGVGYTDDLEFRVVTSQGHIRPGLQLGVPFDMYNRAPDGALANFVEQQRKRQSQEAEAE